MPLAPEVLDAVHRCTWAMSTIDPDGVIDLVAQVVKDRNQALMQCEILIAELGRISQALVVDPIMRDVLNEIQRLRDDRTLLIGLLRGDALNDLDSARMNVLAAVPTIPSQPTD